MKTARSTIIGLLIVILIGLPVLADAHGGFRGGVFSGFGLGLFSGLAFAPRPVYEGPIYYPPPLIYRSPAYSVPAQNYTSAPVPPASYGYSNQANAPSLRLFLGDVGNGDRLIGIWKINGMPIMGDGKKSL